MCAYGATHDGEMYDTLAFRNEVFFDTRIRDQLDSAHSPFVEHKVPFKVSLV